MNSATALHFLWKILNEDSSQIAHLLRLDDSKASAF